MFRSRILVAIIAGVLAALSGCSTSVPATLVSRVTTSPTTPLKFATDTAAQATVDLPFEFKIATTDPKAEVTETGRLPVGVRFRFQAGVGATLIGTPAAGSGGVYDLALVANRTSGQASQKLVLTVDEAPNFTNGDRIYTWALKYDYTPIVTTGYPPATITEAGQLPYGMVFKSSNNGTASISGNPKLFGSTGAGSITITARNSAGSVTETIAITAVNGNTVWNLAVSILSGLVP